MTKNQTIQKTALPVDKTAAISTFLFKYTQNFVIGNHEMLGDYLDKHAAPFVSKASKGHASYQHMEFTGCGSIGMGQLTLESILGNTYQGQFQKGFDESEIATRNISVGNDIRFFIPCFNQTTKLQVRANSKETLAKNLEAHCIAESDRTQITALFDATKMSEGEIREKCVAIRPYMSDLFVLWSESSMKSFTLTSVGMAIAHANVKRLVGEFANLSEWIN